MNVVQPIRNSEIIEAMKQHFKEQNMRNYILFYLGISTGLRISDILQLKVKDVLGEYITIREKKTKKFKRVKMPADLRRDIKQYVKHMKDSDYLFKSRQGKVPKPITRSMAYKLLRKTALEFEVQNIGTHTLRKTFGYHFYKQFKDVALLMELFNHEDSKVTLRYIGINQDTLDYAMGKFRI